jgi:hypothetical protein
VLNHWWGERVLIRPRWTKSIFVAGLLALPSAAAFAAQIEMQIIPCVPPLRDDECGVKINALSGTAEFTTTSGEIITVSPGQAVTVSGNGIVSQSAQDGTMLNFASAGSSSQTGSTGEPGAAGGGGGGGGGNSQGGGLSGGGGNSQGGGGSGGTTASDIRLKHDITLLGRLDGGLGFYRFAYNGEKKAYVGVMAQEVEAVMPEAVVRGPDGYLRVRYDELGLKFESYDEWVASGAKIPTSGALEHAH